MFVNAETSLRLLMQCVCYKCLTYITKISMWRVYIYIWLRLITIVYFNLVLYVFSVIALSADRVHLDLNTLAIYS